MNWLDGFFLTPDGNPPQNNLTDNSPDSLMNGIMGSAIPEVMQGMMGGVMNSPYIPRLMEVLTGVLSNNSYTPDALPKLSKDLIKNVYGLLCDVMQMPPDEEAEYLTSVKLAVEELIIERSAPRLVGLAYLPEPENTDENETGQSATTDAGNVGKSGHSSWD